MPFIKRVAIMTKKNKQAFGPKKGPLKIYLHFFTNCIYWASKKYDLSLQMFVYGFWQLQQ